MFGVLNCKGFDHHNWRLADIQYNETTTSYLTICSNCKLMNVLDAKQFREKTKYNLIRGV